ncbi:hypothetical protein [Neisseria sicca]
MNQKELLEELYKIQEQQKNPAVDLTKLIKKIENENQEQEMDNKLNNLQDEIKKLKKENKNLLNWRKDFIEENRYRYKKQEKLEYQKNELKYITEENNILHSIKSAAEENDFNKLFLEEEKLHQPLWYLIADPILSFFRNITPIIFFSTLTLHFWTNRIPKKGYSYGLLDFLDFLPLAFSLICFFLVTCLNILNFLQSLEKSLNIKTSSSEKLKKFIFCFIGSAFFIAAPTYALDKAMTYIGEFNNKENCSYTTSDSNHYQQEKL